jgi:RNA polymerase sigma factor (sigma-70 family)
MGSPRSGAGLRHLETLFSAGTVGTLSDAELLARYVSRRDEVAFEALVDRHGPMVFQVCRTALSDLHDAQDAFQATFLVLARRAASIREGGSVASWLFGVAGRVAARARVAAARRRRHESGAAAMAARSVHGPSVQWPNSEQERGELDRAAALHQELARLPQKYREAVVLCYLEGRTYQEVADKLRRPIGTVKVRLSRARGMLRGRLARRGVALPAGLAAAEMGAESASAAVPPLLARRTLEAVARVETGSTTAGGITPPGVELAKGALRTMTMIRTLKVASAVLAVGMIALGAGVFVRGIPSEGAQNKAADLGQEPSPEQARRALLGTWESTSQADTPKSFRCVKHITPTHWTWVAYDRDTKVAFSTCGGTWTLRGDKYEETNEFATEDMKHARGKAFAFNYKLDGDKWLLKGGPELEVRVDDVWLRVK